jgi:hypothetical protein
MGKKKAKFEICVGKADYFKLEMRQLDGKEERLVYKTRQQVLHTMTEDRCML